MDTLNVPIRNNNATRSAFAAVAADLRDRNHAKAVEELVDQTDGLIGPIVIAHNQNMTVAAMTIADMKTSAHLS